jgi:CheY-like chemotaxis protein
MSDLRATSHPGPSLPRDDTCCAGLVRLLHDVLSNPMPEADTRKDGRSKRIADVDRKRVLVIDDDLPLRGMLAAALRQHGFQVLLAGDGGEGQRALNIHHPNVILLDLAMPNVNGWDFLQRLKETGHLGKIPVIVLSAHLRVEPQAVLQMGVSAILPKPFNLTDLIDLIDHLCP